MSTRTNQTEYKVQVLDRALAILNALAASNGCLGSTDLGERLNLNKSTVHRLLAVLEKNRFVERDLDSGRFRLGLKLVELGSIALSRFDLHRLAKPFIERLVAETGETAHLGILRQNEVVSLVNAEGHHSVRTPSTVGRRSPVHCTSQGKVLLAYQPEALVDRFLRAYRFTSFTKNTIRGGAKFRNELAEVRRKGYALDDGNSRTVCAASERLCVTIAARSLRLSASPARHFVSRTTACRNSHVPSWRSRTSYRRRWGRRPLSAGKPRAGRTRRRTERGWHSVVSALVRTGPHPNIPSGLSSTPYDEVGLIRPIRIESWKEPDVLGRLAQFEVIRDWVRRVRVMTLNAGTVAVFTASHAG
jgi:DNA-binding IclR family transcriptional regulator